MENKKEYSLDLGGRTLKITLNNWAEQANGSVVAQYGDTVVLTTAVMSKAPREGVDFFPLFVEYQEKFYASGKIKGSRFIKREGRPSDDAVLKARVIDRSIRPKFPKGMRNEVQIVASVLSYDAAGEPEIISLIASSLSLCLSDIPWDGPIGALKIGKLNEEFVLNPSAEDEKKCSLLITLTGTKELIHMIEVVGNESPEEEVLNALAFGQKQIEKIIDFQNAIISENGLKKAEVDRNETSESIKKEVGDFLGNKLENALFQELKKERMDAVGVLKDELKSHLDEKYAENAPDNTSSGLAFFEEMIDRIVHDNILKKDLRVDGRKLDALRPISCDVGILPRTHGSGLFMRGNTHALGSVTLGPPGDEQLLDEMEGEEKKRFMLHYNFPGFSVGEVSPMRGPGRRDIGHGALAEKALEHLIPSKEDFPYTIRVVSEILSSNGSSSMASVCAGSLAMMDAGIPIKKPAAGIAMGLMVGDGHDFKVLTDIQGPEDHYGDMDFKVAGTKDGITAIQMDVKVAGVSLDVLDKTLQQAKKARLEILDAMAKTIKTPREQLSQFAPIIISLTINPEQIGGVIGPGGKMINEIIAETDVMSIDIEDDGKVFIAAAPGKGENAEKAAAWIKSITREIKIGEIFIGKITKITDFGAFVEITPKQEGLVHVSELSDGYVKRVEDIAKVGDIIKVKVIRVDEQGKIALSAKKLGLGAPNEKDEKT